MARVVGQTSLDAYRGSYDQEELRRLTIEYLASQSNATEKTIARALGVRVERVHTCLCKLRQTEEVDDYTKDGELYWHYIIDLSRVPGRSYVDTAGKNHAEVKQMLKTYKGGKK